MINLLDKLLNNMQEVQSPEVGPAKIFFVFFLTIFMQKIQENFWPVQLLENAPGACL